MKTEIVSVPTRNVRGKYDGIWKALLSLKRGHAVKVTDPSGEGWDNFRSLAVCMRTRVRSHWKGRTMKLHHLTTGAKIYLWLLPAGDGELIPASVIESICREFEAEIIAP